MTIPRTLHWSDDTLYLIDQTKLPVELVETRCDTVEKVFDAIVQLKVRGAPAIGCAAAFGVIVGIDEARSRGEQDDQSAALKTADYLATSRPTAVNLFWALDRMRRVIESDPSDLRAVLLQEAHEIAAEDKEMCAAMGRFGAPLMPNRGGVLTHCNAGGLATAGDGTALAVIFEGARQGKTYTVYADETRPLLQGARLTSWECVQRDVPVKVICDNMAGWAMKQGLIHAVITGADRIAANGDAANKIGTYSIAVLAKEHGIPFYVAAPSSTFDFELPSGDLIPIEERKSTEITHGFGKQTAPENVGVWNPAFDVTPAKYISALITERGVIEKPTTERISSLLSAHV